MTPVASLRFDCELRALSQRAVHIEAHDDAAPALQELSRAGQIHATHAPGGLDAAFEATGTQAGLDLAGEIPRLHGTLSIIGWHVGRRRVVNMDKWNIKALTVINAHERRDEYLLKDMGAALELIRHKRLSMAPLVTHRYGLEQVDEAFGDLVSKPSGFVKAVIEP